MDVSMSHCHGRQNAAAFIEVSTEDTHGACIQYFSKLQLTA